MGRVTRSRFQQLHVFRIAQGRLDAAADRWSTEIGGRLRGEDPRVVDAWLDAGRSSILVVLADRHPGPLREMMERGRAVLGPDLDEVQAFDLTDLPCRHGFAGEPSRSDPGLPNPEHTTWRRVNIEEDDRTLRIEYLRGIPTRLHHVETKADAWVVEVTVFLGWEREIWGRMQRGEDPAFTLIGILEWTEVVLSEPVGDRFVRDGADVG